MKSFLAVILFALFASSAFAAEPPPLITEYGEYTLADGLRLSVSRRGTDPGEFTITRKFPDGTSMASGHTLLARAGRPFVFCWAPERKRVWVASEEVVGYVDLGSLPSEAPTEIKSDAHMFHHPTPVPSKVVAEMPVHFRNAAARWYHVDDK